MPPYSTCTGRLAGGPGGTATASSPPARAKGATAPSTRTSWTARSSLIRASIRPRAPLRRRTLIRSVAFSRCSAGSSRTWRSWWVIRYPDAGSRSLISAPSDQPPFRCSRRWKWSASASTGWYIEKTPSHSAPRYGAGRRTAWACHFRSNGSSCPRRSTQSRAQTGTAPPNGAVSFWPLRFASADSACTTNTAAAAPPSARASPPGGGIASVLQTRPAPTPTRRAANHSLAVLHPLLPCIHPPLPPTDVTTSAGTDSLSLAGEAADHQRRGGLGAGQSGAAVIRARPRLTGGRLEGAEDVGRPLPPQPPRSLARSRE